MRSMLEFRGRQRLAIALLALLFAYFPLVFSAPASAQAQVLDQAALAGRYFGSDAPWFQRNIPFLEIDDPEIQQVYYYRWSLYRAHIREIGAQGTTVLEFLPDVPWAREPFTDLNDSSSFHLMEGRWLRNPAVVNSLIDHLYAGAGNTRAFSESVAAASEAAAKVTGDWSPLAANLGGMLYVYNAWDDHFDRNRNLYWIEPLADATEYTISSIDASGAGFELNPEKDQNHNGFTQGFAFRPSINAYQFGNALAIAHIAERVGQHAVAADYTARAEALRKQTLERLWNEPLQHFTDRHQRSTPFVNEYDFIRGRELVGYLPWFYELVPATEAATAKYSAAWKHLLSTDQLQGKFGMRTVEPSYPRYMAQYRYEGPHPECQWNGPSWPFQTSQALTGLANLLEDYPAQHAISRADYLFLLRQYTHQHYLSPEHLDLQEDYNPDQGGPIVGLDRSHHYAHSTYVDLILSGLVGIRPRADETLEIAPLVDANAGASASARPIHSFALENLTYHGHAISVIYDESGEKYHQGKGLVVSVDGKRAWGPAPLGRALIPLKPLASLPLSGARMPEDIAVNVGTADGPAASASSALSPEAIKQANDGRLWFFPENVNGWSPATEQTAAESWWSVQLPRPRTIGAVEIYFFADGAHFAAPASYRLQYRAGQQWKEIPSQTATPATPLANGRNLVVFPRIETDALRLLLPASPRGQSLRLVEFEAFAEPRNE
jgi:hypothetical protein